MRLFLAYGLGGLCLALALGCASTDSKDAFAKPLVEPAEKPLLSFEWLDNLFAPSDDTSEPLFPLFSTREPALGEPYELTGDFEPQPWP